MPRNIDYGLSPFLIRDEDNTGEEFGKQYEPRLPAVRQEKVPLIGRDENGNIRYLNPNVPIKQVAPNASWVDKYGDIATLNADGQQLPLTVENWRRILGRVNPNMWGDAYRDLLNFLENDEGLFYVDDLPKEMRYWQRDGNSRFFDPSLLYPEPTPIPNFRYEGNETYESPMLLPFRENYEEYDKDYPNMYNYFLHKYNA